MNNYQAGDIILIISKTKAGDNRRVTMIREVMDNGELRCDGLFAPIEFERKHNALRGGQGSYDPKRAGSKPFGLQSIEIIKSTNKGAKHELSNYFSY